MSRRVRLSIFSVAALGLAALLGWGIAGLPAFGRYRGPYGYVLDRIAVPERHTSNVVAATVFDYRGFDTLGEEFILFAAVLGIVVLLRAGVREDEAVRISRTTRNQALRAVGPLMVGGGVLVGLWLVAFGYVTPGGAFQGGIVVASAAVLLYLASGYRSYQPFGHEAALDPVEATGAAGYVIIGLAALVSGLPFLTNLLGPGTPGTLQSGGSIPFLNWAAALEVAAANLALFTEFLQEAIRPR